MAGNKITVESKIAAPVETVWQAYTSPQHITKWNHANDEWHCPSAEHELKEGGRFNYRMEAKDGSMGFDFTGRFTEVEPNKTLAYVMDDGRTSKTTFTSLGSETQVVTRFEAESTNSEELQRSGWQAILDNFKKYTEGLRN